ncbi:hypothetical protein PTKIN_Ptkin05aG0056700 [Pterospermum kingtungense]
MGELQFQQLWEFRRNEDNDPDSSFDNSKSSNGSLLKNHKLVSSLVSVGDDDTSETGRLKQKDNENPGRECQIRTGKAKKRKSRNLLDSKMKRDSPEEVDLRKGETSAYDPAPLDDLKNFMDSLLRDLKVTRENLLKWMIKEVQKLVADDDTTEPKRRKCVRRREKVQLQQTQKSKKVQDKHEKAPKESKQFQHPNNSQKSIQVQHRTNFQPPVHAQQQSNFQESINLQVRLQEENTNKQLQNDFRYGMKTQNSNNRSLVGFPRGINAADSADYFNALGDGNDSGQVTELITSSKNKGDILSKSAKPSSADQNVQVQSRNSVVLAIEAQKSKARSLKRYCCKQSP